MKKFILITSIIAIFTVSIIGVTMASASSVPIATKTNEEAARSAYLVDYATGAVLYSRNENDRLPIASMVKIMTLLLTFENIEQNKITFDQKIMISEKASGMGGSQMFLDANTEYSVSDLIKGIVVCSANDASVAIAETLAGSVEDFIVLMNSRAKALGMENTIFANVTGLPESNQYSTARDVSLMTRALLSHPKYFNYSTIYMENYTHPSGRITELVNTNKLIRFYKGCDSGKTGFTNDAMFCLSASAKRDQMRVIATVVGSPNSKARFAEITKMFNQAFTNYTNKLVVDSKIELNQKINIKSGKAKELTVIPSDDISVLIEKNNKDAFKTNVILPSTLKAPIAKGQVVGKIEVTNSKGELVKTVDLLATQDIAKQSYWGSLKDALDKWF